MRKNPTRKPLELHRETVRLLGRQDLREIAGGTTTNCPGDPTFGDLCTFRGCGSIDP